MGPVEPTLTSSKHIMPKFGRGFKIQPVPPKCLRLQKKKKAFNSCYKRFDTGKALKHVNNLSSVIFFVH